MALSTPTFAFLVICRGVLRLCLQRMLQFPLHWHGLLTGGRPDGDAPLDLPIEGLQDRQNSIH